MSMYCRAYFRWFFLFGTTMFLSHFYVSCLSPAERCPIRVKKKAFSITYLFHSTELQKFIIHFYLSCSLQAYLFDIFVRFEFISSACGDMSCIFGSVIWSSTEVQKTTFFVSIFVQIRDHPLALSVSFSSLPLWFSCQWTLYWITSWLLLFVESQKLYMLYVRCSRLFAKQVFVCKCRVDTGSKVTSYSLFLL